MVLVQFGSGVLVGSSNQKLCVENKNIYSSPYLLIELRRRWNGDGVIDVGQAAGDFRCARISDQVWLVVKWRFCVLSVCQRGKSIPETGSFQ